MALELREQANEGSRLAILEAAAQCFMDRGYAAASIDEVARSLGATKGRIYHHYPSKTDLFADVFRHGMDINYQAIAPYREMRGRALERWKKMAFVHARQMIVTRPFQRAVWIGVEMHMRGAMTSAQRDIFNELIDYRARYGTIFKRLITRGREEGDFVFSDPSVANQLMFMTLNSPIFWYTPRPGETDKDVDGLAAQIVDFARGGLTYRKEGSQV
jgi:AcrR family transcriptional regulator